MGSPALGGEAARAPIVIFDINEVLVVTMMRMIVVVMWMVVTMMRMIMIVMRWWCSSIWLDGDDDGGGCQKVRAPSCKVLFEKEKVVNIFNLKLSKITNNHD